MVAEAPLIAIAIEGAEGFHSSVFLVFFQQEGGIVDVGLGNAMEQRGTDQDVVDALPPALIAIGALSTMSALSLSCDVMQFGRGKILESRTVSIVVEIACHNDFGVGRQRADNTHQSFGYYSTIRTGSPLPTKTTGGMNHKDVERVVAEGFTFYI